MTSFRDARPLKKKKSVGGGFFGGLFGSKGSSASAEAVDSPPVLPKGVPAPYIVVQTATYDTDMMAMVEVIAPSRPSERC